MDFFIHCQKIVPQSLDITSHENFCPLLSIGKRKGEWCQIDWRKKSCTNVQVTSPLRIHVKALQTVTMPNGGSHSLGKTSDQIMKKRNPSCSWHLMNEWTRELPRSGKNPQLRLKLLRSDIASQQQQFSLASFTHILFFLLFFPSLLLSGI